MAGINYTKETNGLHKPVEVAPPQLFYTIPEAKFFLDSSAAKDHSEQVLAALPEYIGQKVVDYCVRQYAGPLEINIVYIDGESGLTDHRIVTRDRTLLNELADLVLSIDGYVHEHLFQWATDLARPFDL